MNLYSFELLFFGGTVLTEKFCVGVPFNKYILPIYLHVSFQNTAKVQNQAARIVTRLHIVTLLRA